MARSVFGLRPTPDTGRQVCFSSGSLSAASDTCVPQDFRTLAFVGDVPMPICLLRPCHMSACQVHRETPALTGTDRCLSGRGCSMEHSTENVQSRAWEYSTPGPRYLFVRFTCPPFCSSSFDTQPLLGFLLLLFQKGLEKDSVSLSD